MDFVVWTGDSARHDSDEEAPRSAQQVLKLNNYVASKIVETFGDKDHDLTIPVVPTFGNNDILPHNILLGGPNKWLKTYTSVWKKFIPEEQRHGFERGGWFFVEVIPKKLAVFSLNTLYFFDHNTAVDGCNAKSEPGYEHMEWLRIQLQMIRERGMKAIVMGHVPPARTDSKQLWDETCWQKYTLYLQQFRDVVVGGFYGHMNIDHFLLQDTKQVDIASTRGFASEEDEVVREFLGDELNIQAAASYLEELRDSWSKVPDPRIVEIPDDGEVFTGVIGDLAKGSGGKSKKDRNEDALKKMGGVWGERYQLSTVGPSVVPNYFPTLRIVEYNTTGLDKDNTWATSQKKTTSHHARVIKRYESAFDAELARLPEILRSFDGNLSTTDAEEELELERKKKKHHKKPKKPKVEVPAPPDKTAPPGPAYSPQSLTLLGYTQYFSNLTYINNDFTPRDSDDEVEGEAWKGGKHKEKKPKDKIPKPKKFKYEVEYSTFNDTKGFRLKDMTVRSYLKLAHRIGQYSANENNFEVEEVEDLSQGWELIDNRDVELVVSQGVGADDDEAEITGKKKHKKKKHHKDKKSRNQAWYTFFKRAFVGVVENEDLKSILTKGTDEPTLSSGGSDSLDKYLEL